MIEPREVHHLCKSLGVPLVHVEKDYVMGWLLWGISQDPWLHSSLIVKGGSCLRKLYFPDTRFSEDLDFTTEEQVPATEFRERLGGLLERVRDAAGISFERDRTRVDEKPTPDPEAYALDARVYFRGFAGDGTLTFRVKFDISPYERIILPVQEHPIIHGFSDAGACAAAVHGYSLEEILAEKLRSWIQRTRARDLFDVAKIILSGEIPVSKRNILSVFLQKTIFKDIPNVGRAELLSEEKFGAVSGGWLSTIVCPANALIVAANAITTFRQFVNALFQPEVLSEIQLHVMPRAVFGERIPAAIREAIIAAGQARKLLRLRYQNRDRTVEPYSFRYKIRKSDGRGVEYFFGYDQTRGHTIKCFFVHEIQSVSILPEEFQPRFTVEF
jgi:predicted nucleotidyltransferase component of viral defense system